MTIKQFEVAAKTREEREESKFSLDGKRELVAYKPEPGQLAYLMATSGRGTSNMDRVAGVINFLIAIMEKEDADYIESRLLDPADDFEVEDIENILEWLVEEWSGNPTAEPSGSTSSPSTDGQKSTERTPTLI